MRYFLKNIAQDSMPRTILFIVLGVAMWVPSFLKQENTAWLIATLVLVILNTLLTIHYFYKSGITNLPSTFVAATAWFGLSTIPILHTCWQTQFVIMGVLLACLVLLKMDYQHEATEEAFLATLICCVVAVMPTLFFAGIMVLWFYLIVKRQMTWRVWAASLIAIALRVVLMAVLHYMGWWSAIWMENIPALAWQSWAISGSKLLVLFLTILLPLRRPSLASGILYLVCMIGLLVGHVVCQVKCI